MADLKNYLDIIGGIFGAIAGIYAAVKIAGPWWRTRRDRRSLQERFGAELYPAAVIERSTRHYIEPNCQSLDPAGAEEPRLVYGAKENLFAAVDEGLQHPTEYRYIILLADSGMGKTSFLLNYYARHVRQARRPFDLALIPLGIPDADSRIAAIANKRGTVLFLDALDEDTLAIKDHAGRLRKLLEQTRDFSRVLITCRTQFFPKEEEIPPETGIVKIGPRAAGEKAQYALHKLYLAPFTDGQVQAYLKRRYRFWQRRQRAMAQNMVQKIPQLSVRPMLLAHIDDLVRANRQVNYAFELYEEMVEAWLQREEGIVPGLKKEPLRQFSERLAVDLYINRQRRGAERIPREELAALAQSWNIPLDDWQLTGRSLLNRDALGNCKFAHRSIMEYLFVKRFMEGDEACIGAGFTDLMKAFFAELISFFSTQQPLHQTTKESLWLMIQRHVAAKQPIPFDTKAADLSGFRLALRSHSSISLNEAEVRSMLQTLGFFDKAWHKEGKGITHLYELRESENAKLVIDHATGLTWQQSGSSNYMNYADAEKYVRDLNAKKFAGYNDWRLPTLDEAMSLMEPKPSGSLYIDPVFDRTQNWIWTADKADSAGVAWVAGFYDGICYRSHVRLQRRASCALRTIWIIWSFESFDHLKKLGAKERFRAASAQRATA